MSGISSWISRRNGLKIPSRRLFATAVNETAGYRLIKSKPVPELDLTAHLYKHEYSGSEHLHIDKKDKNNVFCIGFKTNAPDSTGVPHILEHTTLCGSQRFPVRDPFFKMLNRSLANFMNAMTATDYTFYPFATTNKSDFANLRHVYLDSTLHPLLRKIDFLQEGWRLEPTVNGEDLSICGVVYNEMKGQMSDPNYYFYSRFQEAIYPSLNNSAGDPAQIPSLSYEGLVKFHHDNYHPSNAKTFTYGDMPVQDTLEHLNGEFRKFVPKKADSRVFLPINLAETKRVEVPGQSDVLDTHSGAGPTYRKSLSWFAGDPKDLYNNFCLGIISSLLMGGHSSPLHQVLLDSTLGSDWSVNSGFESLPHANLMTFGLQGVKQEDLAQMESLILSTIQSTLKDGFDLQRVEATLHQMEISKKNTRADFGMSLLYGVTPMWFNSVDPTEILEFDSIVNRLRKDLANDRWFLEKIARKYFGDDKVPHFIFTMVPKSEFGDSLLEKEHETTKRLTSKLSHQDRAKVVEEAQELASIQGQPEKLDSLPTLRISDIPKKLDGTPLEFTTGASGVPIQWRTTESANGLTYLRLKLSLANLAPSLTRYLPLFSEALTSLGTKTQSMGELEDAIKLKTGGISAFINSRIDPNNMDNGQLDLVISSVALDSNVESMCELITKVLLETNFDNLEKLRPLVRSMASGAINSVAESGHQYARGFVGSLLTNPLKDADTLSGIRQLAFLTGIQPDSNEQLQEIAANLKEISRIVINRSHLAAAITCGAHSVSSNRESLDSLINCLAVSEGGHNQQLSNVPAPILLPGVSNAAQLSNKRFFNVRFPFQVSYTSLGLRGVSYTHEDGPALQVLSNMLTHKYLHSEIREKGGAYGGGASYNGVGGVFSFYSYRDPNPMQTLSVVGGVGEYALNREWTKQDIRDALLSLFQSIDAPQSVSDEGMILFLDGITDDIRQQRRTALLNVQVNDVKSVAERYLVNASKSDSSASFKAAVIGGGDNITATTNDNDWLVIPFDKQL